jgi:hypothetical protein
MSELSQRSSVNSHGNKNIRTKNYNHIPTEKFRNLFRSCACFTSWTVPEKQGQNIPCYIRFSLLTATWCLQHQVILSSTCNWGWGVGVWGARWRSWLRHCITNRKVAGSIPDGVIGILHWHTAFGRTMALGSTQPLTEMSTRNISWGVNAAAA